MKYAIHISEDTLDLIQHLNDGVRPQVEVDTYFVFDSTDKSFNDIKTGDQMYDHRGHSREKVVFL